MKAPTALQDKPMTEFVFLRLLLLLQYFFYRGHRRLEEDPHAVHMRKQPKKPRPIPQMASPDTQQSFARIVHAHREAKRRLANDEGKAADSQNRDKEHEWVIHCHLPRFGPGANLKPKDQQVVPELRPKRSDREQEPDLSRYPIHSDGLHSGRVAQVHYSAQSP